MSPRVLRVVAGTAAAAFLAGVVLLAAAVVVDLPGPFAAFGDPTASWPVLVLVALAATAVASWWWPARHRGQGATIPFLAAGTVTIAVLGAVSYGSCPQPGESAGWSVVARTLSLVLNGYDTSMFDGVGCPASPPLALQFARLTALVILIVAASRAVAVLLRGQLHRAAVRFAPRLALAVGVDDESIALLASFADREPGLVRAFVASDADIGAARTARAMGWRVAVVADPAEPAALRALSRRRRGAALEQVAVLPADTAAAQRLMRGLEEAVQDIAIRPVRVLLRIDDAWQAEDWRRRYLGRADRWQVDTISIEEVTAALLCDALGDPDRVVIVGRSPVGFAVLAELAQRDRERLVVPDGAAAPEVVVLDARAEELVEQFRLGQRRFGNDVRLAVRAMAGGADPRSVEAALDGAAHPVIVFTDRGDDDLTRFAETTGVRHPEVPVFVRMPGVRGIGREPLLARVRAYGPTLAGPAIDRWERLARLAHERFIREHPQPELPSRRPWATLPAFYRTSNVRQILSTLESAVRAGRSWGATDGDPAPPTAAQLELMARAEHESWRLHYRRHGWRLSPVRDDARRRHPDLVPWKDLDEARRGKVVAGVESSLELLATLGYRSIDAAPRWHRLERRGEVRARRRESAWEWTLADGTVMHGAAGDWELRDDDGATWSVVPDVFARSYERIGGNRYRRIGVVSGRVARPGERIRTLEGDVVAAPGAWVLRGVAGEEWVVSGDHVARHYRDLGELATKGAPAEN